MLKLLLLHEGGFRLHLLSACHASFALMRTRLMLLPDVVDRRANFSRVLCHLSVAVTSRHRCLILRLFAFDFSFRRATRRRNSCVGMLAAAFVVRTQAFLFVVLNSAPASRIVGADRPLSVVEELAQFCQFEGGACGALALDQRKLVSRSEVLTRQLQFTNSLCIAILCLDLLLKLLLGIEGFSRGNICCRLKNTERVDAEQALRQELLLLVSRTCQSALRVVLVAGAVREH